MRELYSTTLSLSADIMREVVSAGCRDGKEKLNSRVQQAEADAQDAAVTLQRALVTHANQLESLQVRSLRSTGGGTGWEGCGG